MSEVRTDHELPSVVDTDPKVVTHLAELLAATIDYQIPGLGINHDPDIKKSQRLVHRLHQKLVLRAAVLLEPTIDYQDTFGPVYAETFTSTHIHDDLGGYRIEPYELGRLKMLLRLHTSDDRMAANVTLVAAGPGLGRNIGDSDLFDTHGLSRSRYFNFGYEMSEKTTDPELLLKIEQGSYDPIVSDSQIYTFLQNPLSSVLFRTSTSMGPSTAHGFMSRQERTPFTSDFTILSQSL